MIGQAALGVVEPEKLHAFVEAQRIGVVTDMGARGIISERSEHSLGFIGFNSDPRALGTLNSASDYHAEIVITVGVRSETEKQYISSTIPVLRILPDDLPSLVRMTTPIVQNQQVLHARENWITSLLAKKPRFEEIEPKTGISYQYLLRALSSRLPPKTRLCLDAGHIRRAGTLLISCEQPRTLFQSDSLSPMGFGLCASIGVKLACPDDPVVALVGDGSMRMHGLEIATAIRYQISVIFVLVDNCSYASVGSREGMQAQAELMAVDWNLFAQAHKLPCIAVDDRLRIDEAIEQAIGVQGPVLLWVKVSKSLDAELRQSQPLEYRSWLSTLKN